ncbi:MAG: virulence-associated E family protein [[Lactobacillus] timonensis]|jgi:hypothetical protein|uniref:VapE domain-containing protein n=1 Tax=[Lactobacillus] timonensis TaxID=1970790 RepID=UPI0023523603|nr:VapE domain-containing protein [[Lactobacillus] timonensis]MCI1926250.1 virulence-associated E family protein [[Lactobacillus] timonensis]MCI1957608.1 virulence-associated E family protein [[Lactobacillus] timonensis]
MLPLDVKFNLNSFVIAYAGGRRDTFDGLLSDAYASLKDGDMVAYSNLGPNYVHPPYMSWVPVIVDAENLHDIRPAIRKLSSKHSLAVGRISNKQVVLIFPLNRNFKVNGSDKLNYQTTYQALLSYFVGVVKNAAKDADIKLSVHQMPYLQTPSSDGVALVSNAKSNAYVNVRTKEDLKAARDKNDTKEVARLKNAFPQLSSHPRSRSYKYMHKLMSNGDDDRTLFVLKALQYSHITSSMMNKADKKLSAAKRNQLNAETYKQLYTLVYEVYLADNKGNKDAEDTFNELSKNATQNIHKYGRWTIHFEDITPDPSQVYGLRKEWSLKFHDGASWIVPTDTLIRMLRADVSDVKKPNLNLIMVGKDKNRHPHAGMVSNYEIEITDPRICGNVLAFNRISKKVEFLHAFDTEFVHGQYEERDDDGNVTKVDRSRAFHLDDSLLTQIMTGLEQVEMQSVDKSKVLQAISAVAHNNAYDPVTNYIDALPQWDQKSRLESIFIKFLGVPDTAIMRKESQIFGIVAVYMALNPGAKFDQVFDFVGDQGIGKTSFLQKFFNSFSKKGLDPTWPRDNFDWYVQGLDSFTSKDALLSMAGKLCVNDDEMTMSKHAGVETLKAEATMQSHSIRAPYAAMPSKIDRTWIICRTTNLIHNLYYASNGLRKFVPFRVSKARHTVDCAGPNSIMTPSFVDQLWAESYARYKQLKKDGDLINFLTLSCSEESQLKAMRVSLQYIDDTKVAIIGFVNDRLKSKGGQWPMEILTSELVECVSKQVGGMKVSPQKIQPVITNDLGFTQKLIKTGRSHTTGYVSTDESPISLRTLNDDMQQAQSGN